MISPLASDNSVGASAWKAYFAITLGFAVFTAHAISVQDSLTFQAAYRDLVASVATCLELLFRSSHEMGQYSEWAPASLYHLEMFLF